MAQTIAVLDFGSQLTQVIARRIRECQVYSKIYHFSTPAAKLREEGVVGIILSGGPQSVYAKTAPHPDPEIFKLGVPVLGICYGVQLMGYFLGGKVARWWVPERWSFIEAVPLTGTGKYDKKVLRKQYADGELTVETLGGG